MNGVGTKSSTKDIDQSLTPRERHLRCQCCRCLLSGRLFGNGRKGEYEPHGVLLVRIDNRVEDGLGVAGPSRKYY